MLSWERAAMPEHKSLGSKCDMILLRPLSDRRWEPWSGGPNHRAQSGGIGRRHGY